MRVQATTGLSPARVNNYGRSDQLVEWLRGGCQACGSMDDLHVDHDHACCPGSKTCGTCVRGVLCGGCNRAAGCVSDDPDRLHALAWYLEESRAAPA